MAQCGIPRIDGLLSGTNGVSAIGPRDPDKAAIGALQDLLAGLGQPGLPGLLSPNYGTFGPATAQAVRNFCLQQSLPPQDSVDYQTLKAIVQAPAGLPIASRSYLTLVLDFPFDSLTKVMSVTAQMEGAGRFSAQNRNSDHAGLSFGLIQWAQKPGRLTEILRAFSTASSEDFTRIFGAGDAGLASALLIHTQKPKGGIDPASGLTTDPAFDLIAEPWTSRFKAAAVFLPFQEVQVRTALKDFSSSLAMIRQYAPQLKSERAVGFMLDLANQFGDPGARSVYQNVQKPGMPQDELLRAIADESVERIQDAFKAGTQARRNHFLTTPFLSDGPFGS